MALSLEPVETEQQYERALDRISKLMEAEPAPDSAEGQVLSSLITLVEAYEDRNHPIGPSEPADIIRHHMERLGLNQKELSEKTDIPESRISDLLNGRREPSKAQIITLSEFFGISADLLIPTTPNRRQAASR